MIDRLKKVMLKKTFLSCCFFIVVICPLANADELKIMSWNVLHVGHEEQCRSAPSYKNWEQRWGNIASVISYESPDIIAFQELKAIGDWLENPSNGCVEPWDSDETAEEIISDNISTLLSAESYGLCKDNGTAIYFRKSLFNMLHCDTSVLESIENDGYSKDGSMVHLGYIDEPNNPGFMVFNLHLFSGIDGAELRMRQVESIRRDYIDNVKEVPLNTPFIVAGDLNSDWEQYDSTPAGHEILDTLLYGEAPESRSLIDPFISTCGSREACGHASYIGSAENQMYFSPPINGKRLDYVLPSSGFSIVDSYIHNTPPENFQPLQYAFSSDHLPIITVLDNDAPYDASLFTTITDIGVSSVSQTLSIYLENEAGESSCSIKDTIRWDLLNPATRYLLEGVSGGFQVGDRIKMSYDRDACFNGYVQPGWIKRY
ncbi:endonuclease/exonuclease/phosphatase family protein [Microbulbifer sp. TRSA001]|uniref:endonuclease/exonuclease/phosphatase family protein n=1 Tax=Microbulbifer sp. TRSA001 TaxID=3243381 RepID=UPI0040390BD4